MIYHHVSFLVTYMWLVCMLPISVPEVTTAGSLSQPDTNTEIQPTVAPIRVCPLPQCNCSWDYKDIDPSLQENTMTCQRLSWGNKNVVKVENPNVTITAIDLSLNKLTDLPIGYFDDLKDMLEVAKLNNNSFRLMPQSVRNLKDLIELEMKNNNLRLDRALPFQFMKNLEILHLEGNQITKLKSHVFSGLKSLEELYLSKNKIRTIESYVFQKDLKTLEILKLDENMIQRLERRVFSGLQNLEDLSLMNNQISYVDKDAFVGLGNLYWINLDKNRISSLHVDSMRPMGQLWTFSIDENKLKTIPETIFDNNKELRYIYMENNELTNMPKRLFDKVAEKLTHLYIGKNKYTSLPVHVFDNMPKLRHLSFYGSPISAIPDLSTMTDLYFLSISETKINHLYPCDIHLQRSLHQLKWWNAPIACDCDTRWVREWFDQNLEPETKYEIISNPILHWKCASPPHLKGKVFHEIPAENFTCGALEHPLYCHGEHHWMTKITLIIDILQVKDTFVEFKYRSYVDDLITLGYQKVTWSLSNTTDEYGETDLLSPRQDSLMHVRDLSPAMPYSICVTLFATNKQQLIKNCTAVVTAKATFHTLFTKHPGVTTGVLVPAILLLFGVVAGAIYIYLRPPRWLLRKLNGGEELEGISNTLYNASGDGTVEFQPDQQASGTSIGADTSA